MDVTIVQIRWIMKRRSGDAVVSQGYWHWLMSVFIRVMACGRRLNSLQCSVAPTEVEELEQVASRLKWICTGVSCPFPHSIHVLILKGGQVCTDDFLCSPDRLFVFGLVADQDKRVIEVQRTDWIMAVERWVNSSWGGLNSLSCSRQYILYWVFFFYDGVYVRCPP